MVGANNSNNWILSINYSIKQNNRMQSNSITIKQLRAFVATTEAKSFVDACAVLHLSQPALSAAIKNLEEQVGGKLLARTTRTLSLTPEGESFLPAARQILADWDEAFDDLGELFALRRGKLSIAAMPSYASNLLAAELVKFRSAHPNVKIVLHDVVAESVVDMVRNGQVEIGLTFWPGDDKDLEFTPLFDDRFQVALPPDNTLTNQSTVRWQHLEQHPLILLQLPSSIRRQIDKVIEERQLNMSVEVEAHQLSTIGRLVANGLGVSIVPDLCKLQMQEMGAVCRPLVAPTTSRRVGLVTRKRYPLSSAGAALAALIIPITQ